nr:hypothetical protein [Tanacetum cinerariifolium]
MNMGFNEIEEYKKTFIGSGVGTLQGVEFEVEPQKDHTFEVEPYWNVDHVVGWFTGKVYTTMYESGIAKHLGVAVIQQQNGLVKEMNMTVLAKVVLYMNMGFNEIEEYKKTFIGSGVGTLQGVEFEVEPQKDHTFEVEPYWNVDHVVGWFTGSTNSGFDILSSST